MSAPHATVDGPVANVDQAAAWDGAEGEHWVQHQDRYEAMTRGFTAPLLEAATLAETDRILDVGCGCGHTTRVAAQRARQGTAVGVDLSGPMLARAREQADDAGIANVRFLQADAQVHPFTPGDVDVALSKFGVMFFDDPVAAFANVRAALAPGGHLMFLCWQDMGANEWLMVPAGAVLAHVPLPEGFGDPGAPGGFSLADPRRITEVLTAAGFEAPDTTPVATPMRLGADADDAMAFLGGTGTAREILDPVAPVAAFRALDAMRDALRPYEGPGGVVLGGAAWLVRTRRR